VKSTSQNKLQWLINVATGIQTSLMRHLKLNGRALLVLSNALISTTIGSIDLRFHPQMGRDIAGMWKLLAIVEWFILMSYGDGIG